MSDVIHVVAKMPSGVEIDLTPYDEGDAWFIYKAFRDAGTVARIYRYRYNKETIVETGGG